MMRNLTDDATYRFRINTLGLLNKNGNLPGVGDTCTADATGPEFNPLIKKNKWGVPYPGQDEDRGTIDDQVADGNDTIIRDQEELLQNWYGFDGILGRSITVSKVNTHDDSETILSCCTLGVSNFRFKERLA